MARGGWMKRIGAGLVLLVMLAGALTWAQRTTLRAWYNVRSLRQADEAGRDGWVDRIAALGEPCVPGLIACLLDQEEAPRANASVAMARLAHDWGPADPRTLHLIENLSKSLPSLPPASQAAPLEVAAACFTDRPANMVLVPNLVPACARLLEVAAADGPADPSRGALQLAGLHLAGQLFAKEQARDAREAARAMVRAGFRSADPSCRLKAVQLSLHPEADLLEQVVSLLQDPAPEVRRAALLAVGSLDQLVRDEGLLPALHDPDPEVRKVCEDVLRDRGLRPEHLQIGRLLTHPHPGTRLQVLDHLAQVADLDPGLWLRRLSHDQSPAVRVAALRAMSQQDMVDLTDRIDQMARTDPSPTVCQLAQFYLKHHRPTGTRLRAGR